jgi:type II secretory pathway component GspD/PulD (secretin)
MKRFGKHSMKRACLGLAVSALLLSCAKRESQQVAASVDNDFINAYEAFEMAKDPRAKVSNDTVSTSEGIWLGDASTILDHKNNLPKEFETDAGITILLGEPVSLQVLANNIHSITGVPVKIDSKIAGDKLKKTMGVGFTGKLSQLLSQVATDLDLLWYYDKSAIVFYETETRTFSLYALGTDISYQSSIHSNDGDSVAMESNLKEWDEVETAIGGIIGNNENAKFTVSKSLGTITVTAPPSILSRIGDYIEKQNKRLSQLITIDVKVLQVSITNNSGFGLNLAAAIKSTSGLSIVASPSSPLSTTSATNASSMNIAVASAAGALSSIDGTSALIKALSKQGKVSLVTNVGVTTRNNRIAPVSNTRNTGYIKRFESRNFTTVESSTVDQDTLETGFSMQLLPNILDNGKILMMFRMSIKELVNMDTKTIGEVTLQLPEVEQRSFMQEVVMESGQILVLSGFEKQSNNDTRYGIGSPDFIALSGSRETQSQRDVLVVILTPQVLVSPLDAERNIQQHWGAPLN